MKCLKCNTENSEDSIFCKKCGTKLEEKNTCPNCLTENELDAYYCKECGTKLKEEEIVFSSKNFKENSSDINSNVYQKIIKIFNYVSLGIALALLLVNFGLSFSNYYIFGNNFGTSFNGIIQENINYSFIINSLSEYNPPKDVTIYYALSDLFPSIMCLLGMLTASIGSFVMLLVGAINSFMDFNRKKECRNLNQYVCLSILFLIFGAVVVGFFSGIEAINTTTIRVKAGLYLSGSIIAAICLSMIWLCLSFIFKLVLNYIFTKNVKELVMSILNVFEKIILVVLLISLCGIFLIQKSESYGTTITEKYSVGMWFSMLSYQLHSLYTTTSSSIETYIYNGWLSSLTMVFVYLLVLAVIFGLAIYRYHVLNKENKSSLIIGIITAFTGLAFLIIYFVLLPNIADIYNLSNNSYNASISFASSPIIFFIFSLLYLGTQIAGTIISQKALSD